MTSKPKPKPEPPARSDDPEQSRRFIDMAREVEAQEGPEAMDRAFKRVAKPKEVKPSAPRSHRSGKRDAS